VPPGVGRALGRGGAEPPNLLQHRSCSMDLTWVEERATGSAGVGHSRWVRTPGWGRGVAGVGEEAREEDAGVGECTASG